MLPSGKLAILLLLTVCILASHQVISKKPICSKSQREVILDQCDYFIQQGYPIRLVSRDSPCCAAVRQVLDIECVILQLTRDQQAKYSIEKIRALRRLCELPPPPHRHHAPPPHHHHQVTEETCTTEQKEAVLQDCKKFIKPGDERRRPIPVMGQACCNAVNKVPKKATKIDMQCIINILTDEEKNNNDVSKMLNLPNHCQE